MSVIKKKPFIEKVIASLDKDDLSDLKDHLNANGNHIVNKNITGIESGIHSYLLKLDEYLVRTAITISNSDYCVALAYGDKQVIDIYNLDQEANTYTKIKEYCTISELRRVVYEQSDIQKAVDVHELAEKLESGDDEVIVDLNAEQTKVAISLAQKEVVISAPSTATQGTLTEEQLAALKESKNSYIMFNNERYNLNDDGHAEGSIGYSHTGVENGVFMIKNITITESTLGWELTEKELNYSLQETAPTSAVSDGGIHIVVLDDEPANKYDGYIYLITE